eukprot:723704-Hanusia_phi.AAC.3
MSCVPSPCTLPACLSSAHPSPPSATQSLPAVSGLSVSHNFICAVYDLRAAQDVRQVRNRM